MSKSLVEKKKGIGLKYDNRLTVSYPNALIERIIKYAHRKGITIQDVQRLAAQHYMDFVFPESEPEKFKK